MLSLQARKDFIEGTRQQVAQMRDEVQSFVAGESAPTGCATAKGSAIMGALQGKGYGSVATGDEDVSTDLEMNGKLHQGGAPSATEDILEMDKLGMPPVPARRHQCKKICLVCVCCLLLAVAIITLMVGGTLPSPG